MYNNIKNRLCVACKNLAESNVIPNGAFISIKDSKGQCYALNNNKIPLSEASESNIIIVGFDGNVIEGDVSGIDPYFVVHKVIYNENEEITTIINPRSRYNSIWASLGRSLVPNSFFYCENLVGETLATGSVTLEPGEELYESIGASVLSRLQHKGIQSLGAIIIKNDSAIVWGKNSDSTVKRAIAMEEICFRALQTTAITNGGDSFVAFEVAQQLLME
ncbi:MAG: class II aldolase/adducin family protein [Ruminococcaceae bacterium]|nr:class II aldolase/adducin family protein [Oscillospiraceae bacterium]